MDVTTAKDGLLVITDTKPNAARVRELGYRAADVSDKDVTSLVMGFSNAGFTIVSMLNEEGGEAVRDACQYVGIPSIIVNPQRTRYALEGEGHLEEVLSAAERQFKIAQTESDDHDLTAVGVHSSTDIAMAITSGEFVRELIPTGIADLDTTLGGGIPRGGVVTLGAISSAGKTSLCNQIGDNLARRGVPVLFATLEQSRYELAVMSLSRIMGMDGYDYKRKAPRAIDYEGTLRDEYGQLKDGGARYPTRSWIQAGPDKWTRSLNDRIIDAGAEFQQFANDYMFYLETQEAPTVANIKRAAETVRKVRGGASAIVIIDYLQLLRPQDARRDERLAVNDNMSALRRMARDLETCVIVVSALNRASLTQGVTLSAFRESGGIEYGSDLVLSVQPSEMTEKVRLSKELKANEVNQLIDDFRDADVKSVDVRVLKNRAGAVPKDGAHLYFDGRVCYFYGESDVRSHVEDDVVPLETYYGDSFVGVRVI